MLKKRMSVAKDVTAKLTALESAIDQAIACAGDLTSSASSGREKINASAIIGHDAIAHTGNSLTALIEARSQIVDAHHAYAKARDQIGLRTLAAGDLWKGKVKGLSEANNDAVEELEKIA